MRTSESLAIGFILALTVGSSTGTDAARTPPPWTGQPAKQESIAEIMLREKLGLTRYRLRKVRTESDVKPAFRAARSPRRGEKEKPAGRLAPSAARAHTAVTVATSFIAAQYADTGVVPPDSMGDIGLTQFLLCINGRIRTFDRSGNPDGALNVTTANFFDSIRGDGDTADPRVRYDRLSGRWFVSMLSYETPTRIMIAVSSSAVITAATNFWFFQFAFSEVGPTPNSDTGGFFDFDTLGVDRHALYIGGNVFSPQTHPPSYVGSTGFVVNKANLLAANLAVTAFRQMASSTIAGPVTPQGVSNDDPNSNEGYFIGQDISSNDHLIIRKIFDPGGSPSISANIALAVPPVVPPKGGVLALGSSFPLADLDERLFQTRMHQGRLITGHNIEVNASGASDSNGERNGVRWYEIVNLTGTPELAQSGTLFDAASTNPRSYWMPSGAMSGQGHLALACNVAAADRYPEIAAAFRLATDPPGAIGTPVIVQSAAANSNDLMDQFNQHRWGDYSAMSIDPNDNMTFWTVQEYSTAHNSWAVRVIQLKAPPPATPVGAAPTTIVQGQFDLDLVITGTTQNGSGFFDPGAGFPNRLVAVVNGGGITVSRITYTDPTHLTINLAVSNTAAPGPRTVTVTNPDYQVVSSSSGLLTVNAAVDNDSDGVPDWWTAEHFGHPTGQAGDQSRAGDDADGDGYTNIEEFRAHTDPRDSRAALRITAIARGANSAQVSFSSALNKLYRLEARTDLAPTGWNIVADNIAGIDGTTTVTDPAANTLQRFYRVITIEN